MERARVVDETELREAIAHAVADNEALRIVSGGTKRNWGRPVQAVRELDLGGLAGVTLYEPDELIVSARAGTPLLEIQGLLETKGQMLAFEPPDWGPLLNGPPGRATVGGIIATNLSGPRRFRSGAARDGLLGVTAISGRAERFKSGGRVMKNVTGYDLPKIMAGSFGTLGVMTEVILRATPLPEDTQTLVIRGLDDHVAAAAMRDALALPLDISGAAHLPAPTARLFSVAEIAQLNTSATVLRFEGAAAAMESRVDALARTARRGTVTILAKEPSLVLWREIGDVKPFVGSEGPVWRVSTAPMAGPSIAAAVGAEAAFYDWAGGLVWLRLPPSPRADAVLLRRALESTGGHATLVRAEEEVRATVPVFQPQPPALAALSRRLKDAFDPRHVLNPGLMWPEPSADEA